MSTPASGPITGSTNVVLTGSFSNISTALVRFSTPYDTVTVAGTFTTSSTLSCVSPAVSTPATGNVSVALNAVDFTATAATYTFYGPYNISSMTPTSGPITGGTNVTISGVNFNNTMEARIQVTGSGGLDVKGVCTISNSITAVCVMPAVSLPGPVSVTLGLNGQQFTTVSLAYLYYCT